MLSKDIISTKSVWFPVVGEVLELRPEDRIEHGRYAVEAQKDVKSLVMLPNRCQECFVALCYTMGQLMLK